MSRGIRHLVATFSLVALAAGPPAPVPFVAISFPDHRPHLVAARYRATFADGSLTGDLEWDVANPATRETTWAFAPPRVALAAMEWADGEPALMARLPAELIAIRVPEAGGTLSGDWSARSAEDRGSRRFEFRFPAAGVATLDLTLPSPLRPVARADEALRTGPFPTDDPSRHRWRFAFGGRDRLTVSIPAAATRSTPDPGPVTRTSRWSLAAGRAEGTVGLTPDRPFVAGDDATFDVDATARITGVSSEGPCEWFVDPPAEGRPTQRLRVRPLDPDGVARVSVALRADPPSPGEAWAVPTVRPTRRAPADDGIVIRADDSLRLTNWDAGDYRPDPIDVNDAGDRTLRFDGTFAREAGADRRAPRLTFELPPPDVAVAERATWAVDARTSRLRVVAVVTVRRGPLTSLRVTAPAPYRFAAAPTRSDDDGTSGPDPTGPSCDIPFSRPLGGGQSVTVTLSLLATTSPPRYGAVRLAVPALTWDANERSGTVTVRATSSFPTVPPHVVAYQDDPPPGDHVFPLTAATATPVRPVIPPAPEPHVTGPVRTSIRIGRNGLDVTIRGTGPVDFPLPPRFELESVRIADRWRDGERADGPRLTIPAGPDVPFEVRGRIPNADSRFAAVRRYDAKDRPGEIDWDADADVKLAHSGTAVWALRADVIDASVRLAAVATLAVALFVMTRSGRRAMRVLFVVAAAFGGATLFGPVGIDVALPAGVALLGLAAAFVVPHRATAGFVLACGLFTSSALAQPPVAVTNATYRTTEGADDVTVFAVWDVSARGPGSHVVTIPLTGANISSVRLDGSPAFPDSLPAGGFTLPVPTGERRVEVTFVVPVRRVGAAREIRFDGPDVPRGTLTFESSPGTTAVSVASRRGRQTTDGLVTRADLGEGRTVVMRWRPAAPDNAETIGPTREVTVVEIGDGHATATAGITFPASRAGRPFAIRLPEGWAADRVTVRRSGTNAVVPADGAVDGRTLTVTPRAPNEGPVTVQVALSPLATLPASFAFPVVRAAEAPDPRALFAVRLDGPTISRWQRTGALDWPADAAAKALADAGLEGTRPIAVAARRNEEAFTLSVSVAPTATTPAATRRLSWTLGRRGDVTAEVSMPVTAASAIVPIPLSVKTPRVRGADLRGGRRDDGAVEVIRPPGEENVIRWAGSVGDLGAGEHTLPLPPGPLSVRIRPAPGWSVRVPPAAGLTPVANDAESFSVGPNVAGIRVVVSAERPTITAPSVPRADVPTVPVPPAASPVAGPTALPIPRDRVFPLLAWLTTLGAIATVDRYGRGRFRPECVAGLGALGWVAVGPAFIALFVLGLAIRLARMVLAT